MSRVAFLGLSVCTSVCASVCAVAQSSAPTSPAPYVAPATETRAAADSVRIAPATPIPAPLVMAGFAFPSKLVDLQSRHLVRACQAMFERAVAVGTADARVHAASVASRRRGTSSAMHPSATTPSVTTPPESVFVPVSDSAITVGRQCLARVGDTKALLPVELPYLLRYAVGINDDTLVQNIVARQLTMAGATVRDRGLVLEAAIGVLLHNQWNAEAQVHRTPTHDALARHYAAQLDTMQPAGQVLATRIRIGSALQEITPLSARTLEDTLTERIADMQAVNQLAMSVPLRTIPPEDRTEVQQGIGWGRLVIARNIFLKTPTHANLAKWVAVLDSMAHGPKGGTVDSLINHAAPRVEGDWWFRGTAGLASPPVMPTPGTTSLLVFADALDSAMVGQLQHVHAQFPVLQIVLVSMTRGGSNNIAVTRDQLQAEAAAIATRFTNALQFAPLVCVLETTYHTEADASDIPLASPVLDRFHLDPREYGGHMFLIDAQGWLLEDQAQMILNSPLLRRLFAQ